MTMTLSTVVVETYKPGVMLFSMINEKDLIRAKSLSSSNRLTVPCVNTSGCSVGNTAEGVVGVPLFGRLEGVAMS